MKRMLGLLAVLFALSLATMGAVDAQVEEDDLEAVASQEEAADTDDSAADTLSEVSPIETWEVVVALFIPLVVGFVNRAGWTSQYKNAALAVVALLVTIGGLWFQGDLDQPEDWATTFMTVLILAFGTYRTLYQALPIPQWLEEKTGGDPMASSSYNVVK
jgi:predicted ABC-type exoprotein transport system permease subunit